MCDPVSLMIASTAMSVVGQIAQGQQQDMYDAQAQQARNDAAYKADAYKQQAEKIRKAGKAQQGAANAALAASGVKLGEGTPLEIKKTIIRDSEEDALSALLSGKRAVSSAEAEAKMLEQAGDNAVTSSILGAGKTALSAGASYMSGNWKTRVGAGG
jgi:hypothetical protein